MARDAGQRRRQSGHAASARCAAEFVGPILSVMTTCGMYDFAGEWVYRVGMPAKSGVGGGIIAVLPGQLGIGVFSPRSTSAATACAGVAGLRGDLARARAALPAAAARRRRPPCARATRWPACAPSAAGAPAQTRVLDEHGHRAAVFELQGDLRFATLEPVLRDIVDAGDALLLRGARLQARRARRSRGDAHARRAGRMAAPRAVSSIVLTRVRRGELLSEFGTELDPRSARARSASSRSSTSASSGASARLLERYAARRVPSRRSPAWPQHRLCVGASEPTSRAARRCVERRQLRARHAIVRRGDAGRRAVLPDARRSQRDRRAAAGRHQAALDAVGRHGLRRVGPDRRRRALGRRARRHARSNAARSAAERFARLEHERPSLMIRLLHNLLHSASQRRCG